MKIEKREIKFSCGVIAWNFLLIFYFCLNQEFWAFKGPFSGEKQKDMADGRRYLTFLKISFTQVEIFV